MNPLLIAILTSALMALSGCGSMLATMETDTIEEDEGERTWGSYIEDENIETKSRVNIHAADEAFDDAHLVIVSYNGYVLIAGQVPSETLKARATDVVRKIRGVRRIYNELEVAAPSSGMTRTSDTWITTKVKSFLLGNPDIQGNRVKVVLSRTRPMFVQRLFESEIPEIADGVITINAISREPAHRSKVAVSSIDSKVDCVGACVGVRGNRIKVIIDELVARARKAQGAFERTAIGSAGAVGLSLCDGRVPLSPDPDGRAWRGCRGYLRPIEHPVHPGHADPLSHRQPVSCGRGCCGQVPCPAPQHAVGIVRGPASAARHSGPRAEFVDSPSLAWAEFSTSE